jgi:hypothetical protein
MQTALGIIAVMVGVAGLVGQLFSALNPEPAPRRPVQNEFGGPDRLYRRLERNSALWDLFVIWTLPVAGVLMVLDHSWWPSVALVAGGACAASAGREFAKMLSFRNEGVHIGGEGEIRLAFTFLGLWGVVAVIVGAFGLLEVV